MSPRTLISLLSAVLLIAEAVHAEEGVKVWGLAPSFSAVTVSKVVEGLQHPWSIAWLPSGEALITERPGRLRRLTHDTNTLSSPLPGVPAVFADGQGGLFDVAVDPHFSKNGFIYLSYAAGDPQDNRTQVTRAILDGTGLRDLRTIFRSSRGKAGSQHFGGRLLFLPDETLLVSIGDGGNPPASIDGELMRDQAQRLANHFGKVVRITRDGTPAGGGQFGTAPGTQLDLWTIGHRNMQGLALDRRTGQVYASEHGPRGGDEVNALFGGGNFGWPVVTYGVEYSGRTITEARSRSGMRDPLLAWVPSIAPSGLTLYRGTRFPRWQGKLFAGGLVSTDLRVITLNSAGAAVSQESIPIGARVRDVREGPDGFLYLLTDESNGKVLKLADVGGERGQVSAPLEAPR